MKRKKINWIAVGNLVGFIGSLLVIVETTYKLVIEPLFTNKMVGLTSFGLLVLILAFIVCGSCFNYFEERLNK